MDKNFYITTPIYYPSAKPHMGHAYSSIIADFFARFKRIQGFNVYFLTGTDEHGQKIQRAAEKKGMDPLSFCDEISKTFRDLSKTLNLSNTDYVAFTLANGLEQYLIKENDLVIALTGATLGKIAIVKTKEKLLQNQRVGNIFSINESLLDNTFLFFIISNYLQNQIWSLVSALAQPNIGKSELDKMKIILPSIQEQQKIATILSNMDALIESTSKVIQNTKLLKKSLMQKLLTQGISHTKFKKMY